MGDPREAIRAEARAAVERAIQSEAEAYRLTPQESKVLELVFDGLSNKILGDRLGIAEKTVKHNVGLIFKKFNVRSRCEVIAKIIGRLP